MFSTVSIIQREDCAASPDEEKKKMLSQKKGSLSEKKKRFRKTYDHIFKSWASILKINKRTTL